MFLDETIIEVSSGKGGKGIRSFRREKSEPMGGPDGGDGGKGASVYLRVDAQYSTLLDMGNKRNYRAPDGANGGTSRCTGRSGEDLYIGVPRGTLVKDNKGNILADLTQDGQCWLAAPGGRGGKGNHNFATATNQAPEKATPGAPGITIILHLELKLMADIGLVGFPNAGKSSLVNRISSARPKVGDYPFTTLAPILGIVSVSSNRSFVIADIPGLIEGASEGRGLGHQFLRHVERTHTLLFLLDGFEENACAKLDILRDELRKFHPELARKPQRIALNKQDMGGAFAENAEELHRRGEEFFPISALSGEGCPELVRALAKAIPHLHRKTAW